MRIIGWVFGGMAVGVVAGVAAGLLRRQPARYDRRAAYAGGYAPPTPSRDRTVVSAGRTTEGG